jgi:hypothetical protein
MCRRGTSSSRLVEIRKNSDLNRLTQVHVERLDGFGGVHELAYLRGNWRKGRRNYRAPRSEVLHHEIYGGVAPAFQNSA